MKPFSEYLAEAYYADENPVIGDNFDIIIKESFCLETSVAGTYGDGILIEADQQAMDIMYYYNIIDEDDSDSPINSNVEEAKYHGRTVPLGKPMKGDVKKSKVYVKNPKTGKVVKVNFGDKKMRIKKSSPSHRKSFRARHNCANPGPRTKARYWSCRAW
jgi:hypothetical protein